MKEIVLCSSRKLVKEVCSEKNEDVDSKKK